MATSRLTSDPQAHAPELAVFDSVVPTRLVLYGDFNCPWSYLASRRAGILAAAGTDVDWRAVEHEPNPANLRGAAPFHELHHEMNDVVAALIPGETLPYCLAGFIPRTRAAVLGYAEAYLAGLAPQVRDVLFEGFWLHAIDLGDNEMVHTLLVDVVRCGASTREHFRDWGYGADPNSSDVTPPARSLADTWLEEWHDLGANTVPVIQVDDAAPLIGTDAIRWLGRAVLDLRDESSMLEGRASGRPRTVARHG